MSPYGTCPVLSACSPAITQQRRVRYAPHQIGSCCCGSGFSRGRFCFGSPSRVLEAGYRQFVIDRGAAPRVSAPPAACSAPAPTACSTAAPTQPALRARAPLFHGPARLASPPRAARRLAEARLRHGRASVVLPITRKRTENPAVTPGFFPKRGQIRRATRPL